jgi:hypothetical protein
MEREPRLLMPLMDTLNISLSEALPTKVNRSHFLYQKIFRFG